MDFLERLSRMGVGPEAILERIPHPVYLVDTRGTAQWANQAFRDLAGAGLVGLRPEAHWSLAAEESKRLHDVYRRVLSGEIRASELELTLAGAADEEATVALKIAPIGADGRIVGLVGIAQLIGSPRPTGLLTTRQIEVLELIRRGRSVVEVAADLHVAPITVRNHLRHVFDRLGVHSRLGAVVRATALGILPATVHPPGGDRPASARSIRPAA